MKRIFLLGYFGAQNFGDDALLTAFLLEQREWLEREKLQLDLLCGRSEPLDGFHEEAILSHLIGKRIGKREALTIHAADYHALVAPGGSLLQDSTSLKSLLFYLHIIRRFAAAGVPVFLLNQGLGPFRTGSAKALTPRVLKLAKLLSLRDQQSLDWAEANIPARGRGEVVLSADPVLAARFQGDAAGSEAGRLLLLPRPCGVLPLPGDPTTEIQALGTLARNAAAVCGQDVSFLPLHPEQDGELSQQASLLVSGSRVADPLAHERWASFIWSAIAGSPLIISFRLHGLIAAAALGLPALGVAYDPKVEAFCREIGYPFCFPWEIHTDRTQQMLARLWKERTEVMETLQSNKAALIARQAAAQERFHALI